MNFFSKQRLKTFLKKLLDNASGCLHCIVGISDKINLPK
jgi:hypothetical protein